MRFLLHIPLLSALAAAQNLIESSSFGYGDRISPNGYGIPDWHVSGEGQVPSLLSDKVILTPLEPGNTRGAIWAESRLTQQDWNAEVEFRSSGPEKGSGNLQIWYVKDGRPSIGASSLYTVGQFDGFVLVLDQYGGKGGSLRGFLNDGNTDFRSQRSLDSLAFGHCEYAFRNLGRPSKIQIRQQPDLFEVIIDDKLCFASDKIRLPPDYHFGVTAGSAETPDSFEIYNFKAFESQHEQHHQAYQSPTNDHHEQFGHAQPAAVSYDSNFQDLQHRLDTIVGTLAQIDSEVGDIHGTAEARHREISRGLLTRETLNLIGSLSDKLDRVEKQLTAFDNQMSNIHSTMRDSHQSLTEHLPKHMSSIITTNAPRMGTLIFVFVLIQVLLVGAYSLYKRRVKIPKKYL